MEPLTIDGIQFHDSVAFFTGDMQARWYELGVQRGGGYKCGSGCGCKAAYFTNYSEQVRGKRTQMGR